MYNGNWIEKKKMNKSLIKEYINNTDIRILTLDGSDIYGKQTMDGSKYLWLSDNAKCQDNYKIGKFYNSQRWERFDAIICEENDTIKIKLCEDNEIPNAYIVCSKRVFRKHTRQTRALSEVVRTQISDSVNTFINGFNNVCLLK